MAKGGSKELLNGVGAGRDRLCSTSLVSVLGSCRARKQDPLPGGKSELSVSSP